MLERLHLDRTLFYALLALAGLSLLTAYSASGKNLGDTGGHALRLLLGFGLMLVVANMRPETLERWSPIIFGMAVLLLVAVLLFGTVGKGARRWLSLAGFRFQPSEFMKLALPMALAWFFARDSLPPRLWRFGVAVLAIALPAALIARQPDLGTAVLVATGGLALLFIAGLKWRIIVPLLAGAVVAAPIVYFRFLHEYQRSRIDVLLDPQSDPLGTGYQTIQSMIAVGSGGFYGKGWLNSSQAHLEYLPESSTDFVFAVFAEEFGLIGSLVLIGLYLFIIARGFLIAYLAQDSYSRLLAGGVTLTVFLSFFVNTGMVLGVLPVVGVPLPVLSFGGTSLLTFLAAFGVLMSIQTHRRIVE